MPKPDSPPTDRVLVWFSDGAASAVAAKLAVDRFGSRCRVIKCDTTSSEHPDNTRFRLDVEQWIGQSVTLLHSPDYADIDDVFMRRRYMSGVRGAICTTEMKKRVRHDYEHIDDTHVFGYTSDEVRRALAFEQHNPELKCEWLLIYQNISKVRCQEILTHAGIKLPAMYALGFDHNNCLGCVKATSPSYWMRTRQFFPEVFARRARQSREIGARLVTLKGTRIFLDQLPEDPSLTVGDDGEIECGPFCQVPNAESR